MNKIDKIMEKLKGYEDRIFYLPSNGKDIIEFEVELNISFPDEFFDYLRNIGLLQDLIPNVFLTKNEFVIEKEFISRVVQKYTNIYFAFSNDVYGNLLALKDKKYSDGYVYKILHETGDIKKTGYTFLDYVNKWIDKAIKDYNKRRNNYEKNWSVQFCFEVQDERLIYDLISKKYSLSVDDEWEFEDATSVGVKSYSKKLSIMGTPTLLKKMEYNVWATDHYSFDYSESVTTLLNNKSEIENMNILFKSGCLNYKLVNYGIIACLS